MPDLSLPSCRMTFAFCKTDKSRWRVRFGIARIAVIWRIVMVGLSLISSLMRFWRFVSSIKIVTSEFTMPLSLFTAPFTAPLSSFTPTFFPTFTPTSVLPKLFVPSDLQLFKSFFIPTFFPTFKPPFTAPFTTPLSSLLARFLQLHDCHPHLYIFCRPARWRIHKSIWGIRRATTPYTRCSAFLRMLSLPSCLVLCLSFCLIIA